MLAQYFRGKREVCIDRVTYGECELHAVVAIKVGSQQTHRIGAILIYMIRIGAGIGNTIPKVPYIVYRTGSSRVVMEEHRIAGAAQTESSIEAGGERWICKGYRA